jgi:DNA polymerase III epsilon subunit-like protein
VPTGGTPGTRKPTGSRRDVDGDGWADEGTTKPVWVGFGSPEDSSSARKPKRSPEKSGRLSSGAEYMGQHEAPDRDNGAPLHELTANGIYPDDIYANDALEMYGFGGEFSAAALSIANSAKGKPNKQIKVYRAVPLTVDDEIRGLEKQAAQIMRRGRIPNSVTTPLDVSEYYGFVLDEIERLKKLTPEEKMKVNPGNWVTPIRDYAVSHGRSHLNGKYKIVSKTVPAKHLFTDGNSIEEWGYDPTSLSSGQNVRTGNRRANELGLSTEVFDDETGVDEDDPKFFNEDGDFDADSFNEAWFDGEKTSEETTRKLEKEANESYKKLAEEKYPDGKIPKRFSEAKIQMDKVFSTTDDRNLPLKAVQKSLVVARDKDNNIVGAARFKRPTEADDDLYVYHIASYGQEAGAENLGASIFGKILEIANNNNSGITLEATPGSQKYWEDMGFINIDPDKNFFTENARLRLFPDKVRELNSETRDDSDERLSSGFYNLVAIETDESTPEKLESLKEQLGDALVGHETSTVDIGARGQSNIRKRHTFRISNSGLRNTYAHNYATNRGFIAQIEAIPERDEDLRLSSGMEQLSELEMFNYGPLKAAKKVKSTKPKGREEEYWIVVTPDTALAFRASDVNQLRQSLLERFNNLGENPFTNKKAPLKLEDIDIRDALRSSIDDKNVLTVAKMNTYRAGNDNNLEVFGIATRAANRRQGLATEMFNSFREAFPELNLQHSDALTNDGRAFADATPTSEVTGRFSSGRDIKAKLKVVFYGEQNEYSQVEGFEIDGKEFSISRGGDSPGRNMYNGYLAAYDEKGNLAGYIDYQSEDVGRTATIAMVEVGEDYKRTGVASALLDSLLIGFQGYEISPGYTTEDGAAWWRRATGGDGPIIVDGLSSGAQKTSSLPLKSGREYTDDDSRLSSGKTYQEILESQPELSDDKKQLAKNIIEKLKSETLSTEDQFREITDPFGDVMRVLDDSQERYDFKQSIARDIGNLFKGEIDLDEDIIVVAENGEKVNLGRKLFITPADNDVSAFLSPTVRMLDDRDLQEIRAIEPYETFSIPENGNRTAVQILLRLRPSPEAIEELQKNGTPIGYKSFERDADGNSISSVSVGYLDRELSFATNEPDSPITVSHDAFYLQKDAQGLGIASQVNARNEKIYEALGVRSILTWGASGDDSRGATHWPKNGFTWAGRNSKQEFLELIEEGLSDQDNDWFTAEERSRISSLYRMLDLGDGYEYETEASPEELLDFEKAEGLFKKYRAAFYYARTVGASESTAGERLSSAGGRNNPLVIKTDGRYGDTSGKKDFSAEELKTIDDINERLSNSNIDFAWISLENEDGAQTSSPIVNYASRPIVVVRIDDENNVPFYRSTGLGGKDQDLYPAGMWFPFWGYASGANFFVKNEGMHNYYGIPELEEISQQLNKLTSGLPLLKNTDWRNIRSKEDGSMNDDFRELINNTSFVNADRIFDPRSVNHHIDVSKKKLRQVLRSRKRKSTETPSSERLSSGVVGSKSSKDVYDTSVGHNDRRNPSGLLGKSKDGKEYSSIRFNNESYDIKTSKSENGFSVFIENENGQIASLSFSGSTEKELSNLLSYSSSKEAQKSGVLEALFDHVLLEYPDKTLKATSETAKWFNYINNGMADYGVKGFRKYGLSGKYRNGEDVVIDGDYTLQSNLLLKTSPASSFLTPITVNDRTRDIKWNSQVFTIGGESIVFGAPEEAEFGEGIRKLPINPFEILDLDPSSKEGREAALKWYSALHGAEISTINENFDFKPSSYVSALLYAASKGDKTAQKEFDDFVKASDSLLEKIDSNLPPVENPEKALSLNSRMVHQTSFKPPVDEEGNLILKPLEDFPVTAEDGSEVTVNRTTLHFAIDHLAEGHMFRTETDNDSYIVITSIDSFIKENPDSLENFNIVDTAASPPPEEGLRFPQGTYRLIEVKKGENARQKVEDALRADGVEILVGGERNSGTPGADEAGITRAQILGVPPSVASDIKLAFIEQINRTNVLEDMRYANIPSSTSFLERTSKNALLRIANRKQNTWVSSDKEEVGSRLFSGKAPRYPRSPTLGAFLGEAEERFDGVNSWEEFRERYNDTEMVFLDYETTGLDFDEFGKATRNGQPTQIGLVRIKNGKEIGRLNLFMNPEEPLGDWSRKNLKDADGNPLTDEWLAGQIPMSEAHRQVAEFIGDAIIGVQNATFDKNVLEDTLSDNGIDWRPSGYLDTRDISAMTLPVWSEENQDAPFTVDRNGNKQPSSSLAAITEFLGVELGEGHHNADVDAFATSQVMQKIIDGAIENGWSTDVLSKEKRDAKLKADNDKFDADVMAFEESLADYDERLASGIWLPEDFDISIDEVRQISTGRSLSPSPQARDSQRRQIVIIPTSDASTDNRYMVYAQLEIEGGATTQWGGRGKPGKPTGRIIITGDGVDTARGIQNPDGSISPNTPPGPRRYSGLYGRYREAMIASIINLDLEDKVKPKKNAETGLRSDAKRRPFDGFVIEGETLEESAEILNRLGKELLSEIKKPTWKAPKKRTTRKPTPELRVRPEPRKERPLLGRREAVRPVDRLASGARFADTFNEPTGVTQESAARVGGTRESESGGVRADRIIKRLEELTQRELTTQQRVTIESIIPGLIRETFDGTLLDVEIDKAFAETGKQLLSSISVELASDGLPFISADPIPQFAEQIPKKIDWRSIELPNREDVLSILEESLADAVFFKNNVWRDSNGNVIARKVSTDDGSILQFENEEVRTRFPLLEIIAPKGFVISSDDISLRSLVNETLPQPYIEAWRKHREFIIELARRAGESMGDEEFFVPGSIIHHTTSTFIRGYVGGIADPHKFNMGQDGKALQAFHDLFGHLGTGRAFDRHGEWANDLAMMSIIDHPDSPLTPQEKLAAKHLTYMMYSSPRMLTIGRLDEQALNERESESFRRRPRSVFDITTVDARNMDVDEDVIRFADRNPNFPLGDTEVRVYAGNFNSVIDKLESASINERLSSGRKPIYEADINQLELDIAQDIVGIDDKRNMDRLSSGRPLIPMRRPIEPEAPKPSIPGKIYKYGEPGPDGRAVRKTNRSWLKGMTSEQIAEVLVPESKEQMLEMWIDDFVGDMRIDNKSREALSQYFDNGYIEYADFNPEHITEMRKLLSDSLGSNPKMKWAFEEHGAPSFIPMSKQGADLYESNPRIIDTLNKLKEMRGTEQRPYVRGVANPLLDAVYLNPRALIDLESVDRGVDRLERLMSPDRKVNKGDAHIDGSLQAVLTHEWGHWLHYRILRDIERSGISNRKYYGSGDINDDRYLLAWDVGERYNDRGSEGPERISLFESGSDFSDEEDAPRLITSYGHVNMREAIAEGMVAVLHPNDEVQNTAINKKLRRDISSLLGIDEGDKPWERTERLSSGATDTDTEPASSGGRMRRLINRLRGGEQEETLPSSPPRQRSRPQVPSYQPVTKDLKYFQPPLGEEILNTEGTVPDEQTLLKMTMEDLTSIEKVPGLKISSEVKRVIAQNISDSIETTAREFIQLFEGVNADYLGDRGSSAPFFRNAPNFAEVKKILQNLDSGSESLFEYNFETGKVKPGSSSAVLAEINRTKIYQDRFISKLEDFSLEELLSPRFIYEQQEEGVGLLDRIYALDVADRIGKDDVQKELITPYLQLVQYLQNTMDKARNSESVLAYRTEDNESYSFIFTNPGENPEKALSSLKSNYFVDRLKMTEEQIKELEERGGIVVINREDIDSEKFKSMIKEALIRRIQKESTTTIAFNPKKPPKLTDNLVGIADASTDEGQALLKNALISDIVQTWAISANNANPVALAIQNIAREMFNLDAAIGWNPGITRKVGDGPDLVSGAIGAVSINEKTPDMLPHEFDGAPILPEEQKQVIRNILQAMYDATQKYFEEKGITHVPVWRGMRVSDSSMVPKDYEQIASTAIMRPLSSWTFSTAIANQFAFMGAGELIDKLDDDRAVVMKGFVPVSDIFSIPVTGFGCLGEDEAVLLGRPIDLITVKPATLLGFSGSGENLERLNRIQDFIGRLAGTKMSEFKKTHEMLVAQTRLASRTKPASDERLSSGRNDDSRLVDWDSPEEIIDWDAIGSAKAAGENTTEFDQLDDEEKIEAFVEELNDAWSQWDPCREMRSAAYELAGIDVPKGDPNLSKVGGFWGVGIKLPDKTPITSKERAKFIMAKMAEAVIDDPRFSGNNTSLYRAVMLDEESEKGFLEAMSPGKTIDIPLLSFVDIGPDADQHFLRKFGTDALIELVDFPASYRTRNYFEPIYDSNAEDETLNEIQILIEQLELEIESEQIDDVQATQAFIEELQKILNEYQDTAKRESAKRADLRSQLEELTEDYSITYRWSGKTIDEDDTDYFYDALSATEDEDAYSESVSYEYISGGRMEVVEVIEDESGLYRRIIRLKQTGVYDPQNKGSIIPRSERYSDSPRLASGRKKPTPAKKKSTKAHDEAFEKKYEQKMPEGSGDCFSTAVEQAAILAKKYDDVKIVHGYPLGTGGEALGLRFPHAWVEFTENGVEWVRDYSNGNRVEFPKILYYSIGNIEEKDANKYSRDEAQKMMIERQHYGPW